MFELLKWGETFMNALSEVGQWLFYTPSDWTLPINEISGGVFPDIVFHSPFDSVGSAVLGVGIVGILSVKLVKFFTDLFL